MKKLYILLFIFLSSTNISLAGTLKGGYWACVSEGLFDEIMKAGVREDKAAINYLSNNGCFVTKSGISASLLDSSWGKVKVRVYVGNDSVILWTNRENYQR